MKLICTHASLATVHELFEYKQAGFDLPPFPGYTDDQWGIKAHNRPWVDRHGEWSSGLRIIEVGGAYSRFPEWLGERYDMEPWIGDDFGRSAGETAMWSRWGDPQELPGRYPAVTYAFENFGPGSSYADDFFDRIFSISTLEHVPESARLGALEDIHRTLAPRGLELHTIDISIPGVLKTLVAAAAERTPLRPLLASKYQDSIAAWWSLFERSGVDMSGVRRPSSMELLHRRTLVESPDVVYRFHPPNDAPKPYAPPASLTMVIRKTE